MDPTPLSFVGVPSPFGDVALIWRAAAGVDGCNEPRVVRILLPVGPEVSAAALAQRACPGCHAASCPEVDDLGDRLERSLRGDDVTLPLDLLALDDAPPGAVMRPFQRRVLLAEYAIPRGMVSTYGRIAQHLGVPRGPRAVGRALATNPFPLVIPCHRTVRSDGALSGFGGGLPLKRALLELEGVRFHPNGRVVMDNIYY